MYVYVCIDRDVNIRLVYVKMGFISVCSCVQLCVCVSVFNILIMFSRISVMFLILFQSS